ncbi:hypothetical protein [Stenotrophomonas sp.]|uniref:hypothetical protein n=1 Tax=Stenotrophomonas sp. TaxID=69392 RepID=UPI002FCB7C10
MAHAWVGLLLWVPLAVSAAEADALYIEFLWASPPAGALARQQTRQFVTEGAFAHQICVAAEARDKDVGGLTLDIADATGAPMSRHVFADYRGRKRCFPADLGHGGAPGLWRVGVALGDGRQAEAMIRVDRRIEASPYLREPGIAYVYGRPNYDAGIPAEQWVGRVEWQMDVDAQGRVTHVQVVSAEGVGERLRERAIAAGYISLFPPDPARLTTPLQVRRSLSFAPE